MGRKTGSFICTSFSSTFTYLTKKAIWSVWDTSEVLSSKIEKYVTSFISFRIRFFTFFPRRSINLFSIVQCFSKWANSPLGRDSEGQVGEKLKGVIGGKTHKGGENAQPVIDHWVNFNSLLLWLVSFLQILIYYDNRWRMLLKQFFR